MKEKLNSIVRKAESSAHVPTARDALRAGVSVIPIVGGALDHLLFSKADEIRARNIELAIESLEKKFAELQASKIDLDWFSTGEAISLFKELVNLVEYEDSQDRLDAVSQLYAISSLSQYSHDPNKTWVLRKVSELTNEQRKLFMIVSSVPPEKRGFSAGGLQSTQQAIWNDTVFKLLERSVDADASFKFWGSHFNVDEQLEFLKVAGLLDRVESYLATNAGYKISALGEVVKHYLSELS